MGLVLRTGVTESNFIVLVQLPALMTHLLAKAGISDPFWPLHKLSVFVWFWLCSFRLC